MKKLMLFLEAYKKNDPAARSLLEVFFLYPGPKAIFLHKIAHLFYKMNFFFLARLISEISRLLTGIEIHPGAQIGKRLVIDHGSGVVIGETTKIGDDCIIFHGTTLGGRHNKLAKRHPTIEDRCLLGTGCKILGPITIGHDSKIGANAVVVKNINPHSIIIGAKPLPLYSEENSVSKKSASKENL